MAGLEAQPVWCCTSGHGTHHAPLFLAWRRAGVRRGLRHLGADGARCSDAAGGGWRCGRRRAGAECRATDCSSPAHEASAGRGSPGGRRHVRRCGATCRHRGAGSDPASRPARRAVPGAYGHGPPAKPQGPRSAARRTGRGAVRAAGDRPYPSVEVRRGSITRHAGWPRRRVTMAAWRNRRASTAARRGSRTANQCSSRQPLPSPAPGTCGTRRSQPSRAVLVRTLQPAGARRPRGFQAVTKAPPCRPHNLSKAGQRRPMRAAAGPAP